MSIKRDILINAYQKLSTLPLSFGIPQYNEDMTDDMLDKYIGIDYKDALRDIGTKDIADIETMSFAELIFENRVVYYALRRFRMSGSAFFKFSTANDGKAVDKSMIPKTLTSIINEYDREYRKYAGSSAHSIWDRSDKIDHSL